MARSTQGRGARRGRQPRLEPLEVRTLMAADLLPPPVAPIDGVGNNLLHPDWGSAGSAFLRGPSGADYADGVSAPSGADRPGPREISNAVVAQSGSLPNSRFLTNFVWQWGQFLDHDLDLTETAVPAEAFPIGVPSGDPFFDPAGTGTQVIPLSRSAFDPATGTDAANPRQQVNSITAFIDGSMVYGSDEARATALRTLSGGRLKTSDGDLLPFNTDGLPNAGGTSSSLFVAGDIRVNEQVGLISMHTLFVREHNRQADRLAAEHPAWTDEQVYQAARRIVIGEIQAITYNEFLPALLGPDAIPAYRGYDPNVNPGIANLFATASYRFGHSMLTSELLRLNPDGSEAAEGNLSLRNSFFALNEILDHGIDSLLRGLAGQQAEEIDAKIVDDVRNFLFGPPGAGGFDLASLNIQRGRDHGLPSYNAARAEYGLAPATSFADVSSDPAVQAALASVYADVDQIDAWVGGLAEDHLPGASVGELLSRVLGDQFARLRDGDRFFYQATFHGRERARIEATTLADVIRANTDADQVQDRVFFMDGVVQAEAPPGRPLDAVVTGDANTIAVRDARSGRSLDSEPRGEAMMIRVVGGDGVADRVLVDLSRGPLALPGGVEIHGGEGRGDTLVVRGTSSADVIHVAAHEITVNGDRIVFTGIEEIRVQGGAGADAIQVEPGLNLRVIVDRPPVNATPPRPLPPPPQTASRPGGPTLVSLQGPQPAGGGSTQGTPPQGSTSGPAGPTSGPTSGSAPAPRRVAGQASRAADAVFERLGG